MRRGQTSLVTLAALTAIAMLTPRIGAANDYTDQVKGQLLVAGVALLADGYELTSEPHTGSLDRDSRDELTINLRANQSYKFVGVCDSDCGDLDLYLYDDDGDLISSDVGADDLPVVAVTPRWSGQFTIKVTMVRCSNQPCFYGVGNFRK